MPLAGLAGGIAGGPFIEYLGRRNTILATAVPFIISWLLIACAVNVAMVLAGRFLAGFCVGIASLSLPVYLGETVQPEVRGTLGLLPTAFGNIGILLCFVAGTYMDWSMLAFLGASLPVPFLILMFLIPETPRWFVSRGREERARKALVWLRGKEADVEPELKGLMRSQADADRSATQNTMLELLKRSNLKPLSISLGLMFFQQLSGINAVIFYTVQIFKDAGSTIDGNVCTIIVGIVNFAATFIATLLIDRAGRKVSAEDSFHPRLDSINFLYLFSADFAICLQCGDDSHALCAGRFLLLQVAGHGSLPCGLAATELLCCLHFGLLAGLRSDSLANDGRNSSSQDTWLCRLGGHGLQLVVHVRGDQNVPGYAG